MTCKGLRTIVIAMLAAGCAAAALARPAGAALESTKIYGLRVGTCENFYVQPSIAVDPPRMWASYDTTGRPGQRVKFRSLMFRKNDNGTWRLWDSRRWVYSWARNQAPRTNDRGNLWTYVLGTLIFTGAEQGNAATQFMFNTVYPIEYTGDYRVVIDMVWFRNAYSRGRHLVRWLPLRAGLGGDDSYFFDCNITE